MARQVLPVIDLRTQAERQGITRTQQSAQAIANLLKIVGAAEQKRRERQTLDRITRAISGGATTIEAISAVAGQGPEFSTGIPGALQKIGGMFQPSPGGMGQSIQRAIIGQTIQQALDPFAKKQARADLRYTRARTKAIKQGRNRIGELVNEGYSPADAKKIMDIFHGLKPRASVVKSIEQKSLPEQLTFWQTVYNKTLDPEWGGTRPTADMDASRELAKQSIDRITASMRQSTQTDTSGLDIETDLKNAMSAIENGAPPEQVYQRLIQAYPDRAVEIRRLLGM